MRDLVDVLQESCRIFSALRIRYVVVGGVTSNLLGRGRSTFDVDVIADLEPRDAPRLARAFRERGFRVAPADIRSALRERGHFSIHDADSDYRIDCKGAYTIHERWALEDRRRTWVGRTYAYIDAPENLIVAKLVFGSEQDVLDAEAVYARQRPSLDLRRIDSRSRALGVREEWEALRRRVDTILDAED